MPDPSAGVKRAAKRIAERCTLNSGAGVKWAAEIIESETGASELAEALRTVLSDPMDLPHYGIVGACDAGCPRCRAEFVLTRYGGK
jgi:hypothetical protein